MNVAVAVAMDSDESKANVKYLARPMLEQTLKALTQTRFHYESRLCRDEMK